VTKTADWVLDLGPEGGDKACPERSRRGGEVVAQGTPEQVAEEPRSYTGHYLKPLLQVARAEAVAAKPKRKRKVAAQEREAAE
jgi:excinuclease ABC subunit A